MHVITVTAFVASLQRPPGCCCCRCRTPPGWPGGGRAAPGTAGLCRPRPRRVLPAAGTSPPAVTPGLPTRPANSPALRAGHHRGVPAALPAPPAPARPRRDAPGAVRGTRCPAAALRPPPRRGPAGGRRSRAPGPLPGPLRSRRLRAVLPPASAADGLGVAATSASARRRPPLRRAPGGGSGGGPARESGRCAGGGG